MSIFSPEGLGYSDKKEKKRSGVRSREEALSRLEGSEFAVEFGDQFISLGSHDARDEDTGNTVSAWFFCPKPEGFDPNKMRGVMIDTLLVVEENGKIEKRLLDPPRNLGDIFGVEA